MLKWLSGRVVMQRTATPLTSVRFRSQPPLRDLGLPEGLEAAKKDIKKNEI